MKLLDYGLECLDQEDTDRIESLDDQLDFIETLEYVSMKYGLDSKKSNEVAARFISHSEDIQFLKEIMK